MSDLPYVGVKELTYIFNYASEESTRKAISRGNFPVPVFKLAGNIVADTEVVREYFRLQREEGLAALKTCPRCGHRLMPPRG